MVPWTGDQLGPHPAPPRDGSSLSGLDEVHAAGWLTYPDAAQVFAQTLYQQDGHAITLLAVEQDYDAVDKVRDPPRFRR